jgi:hypothetical protein
MALQRAFRQAYRFVYQAFAKTGSDGVTECLVVDGLLGDGREALEACLDVRLIDPVAERGRQQQ